MCQANRGKLTFLQECGGLRKLQNMYLHSQPLVQTVQNMDVFIQILKSKDVV